MGFLVVIGIIACCYYSSKSEETKKQAVRDNNTQVICPHCDGRVNITSEGEWVCPHCKKEFTYYNNNNNNNNNNNQKSNEQKNNIHDNNAIHVDCPYCNDDVVIKSEGTWVCPYCSETFIYRGARVYKDEDVCNDSVTTMIILIAKLSKADGVVTQK
jgi:ribosomal protein L37AE/L43A